MYIDRSNISTCLIKYYWAPEKKNWDDILEFFKRRVYISALHNSRVLLSSNVDTQMRAEKKRERSYSKNWSWVHFGIKSDIYHFQIYLLYLLYLYTFCKNVCYWNYKFRLVCESSSVKRARRKKTYQSHEREIKW